jgi:hypothetical protein
MFELGDSLKTVKSGILYIVDPDTNIVILNYPINQKIVFLPQEQRFYNIDEENMAIINGNNLILPEFIDYFIHYSDLEKYLIFQNFKLKNYTQIEDTLITYWLLESDYGKNKDAKITIFKHNGKIFKLLSYIGRKKIKTYSFNKTINFNENLYPTIITSHSENRVKKYKYYDFVNANLKGKDFLEISSNYEINKYIW